MYLFIPSVISCIAASPWMACYPDHLQCLRKEKSKEKYLLDHQEHLAAFLNLLSQALSAASCQRLSAKESNIILEYDVHDCKERRKDSLLRSLCLGRVCLVMLFGVVGHCRRHWKRMVSLSRILAECNQRDWLSGLVCLHEEPHITCIVAVSDFFLYQCVVTCSKQHSVTAGGNLTDYL